MGAHWSRDGDRVYFTGHDAQGAKPYRVRPDGTGLEVMPGYVHDGHIGAHPSPSPDETRVAYFRERTGTPAQIWIQNLVTRAVIASGIPGNGPEWSHGEQVAFTKPTGSRMGPISVMNSDGTGVRVIASALDYEPGLGWSADDKWIVARNFRANRLVLVEVATGKVLPLPYSADMAYPTWKP